MIDFEIIVDNIYSIDTLGKEIAFPTTYQVIDIKDLNKRAGSNTKTIELPRTEQNDKIFGLAFSINGRNQFSKYDKRPIRFIKNGTIVFDGVFNISEVTKTTIKIYCFGTLSKVKQILGDKTLNDLELSDLDHTYDASVFATWNNVYPLGVKPDYFYPLIDYGRFQKNGIGNSLETPDVLITDVYPALYVRRAFQQMCLDSGYTLVSNFFNKPEIANIMIPFTNEEFVHDERNSIAINGFSGYQYPPQVLPTASTGFYIFEMGDERYDAQNQWNQTLSEYVAAFSQSSSYRIGINVDFTINRYTAQTGNESYFYVEVDTGSGWTVVRKEVIQGVNNGRFVFGQLYQGTFNLLTGDKVRFRFEKGDTVDMAIRADLTINPEFGGKTIEVGEIVQIAPNLPPLKQIDVFTAFFKMFNLIIDVNDATGQIFIETETDYYLQGGQKDFSEKIALNPEPIIKYTPTNFGKNYSFEYEQDEEDFYLAQMNAKQPSVAGYYFGDGRFTLNPNEPAKVVGKVPFSPTVVDKSFTYIGKYLYLPCMLALEAPYEKNTSHSARLLSNGGLVTVSKLSDGLYTAISLEGVGSVSTVPYCYFAKQNFDVIVNGSQSLNFSDVVAPRYIPEENLVRRYYKSSLESLSVSAQLTAYFNLTAKDISQLNFSTFWYVEYFNAIFKLNRIVDYNPNGDGLTKVELINVGVFDKQKEEFMPINPPQPTEDSLLLAENGDFIITEDFNFIKV